MSQRLLAIQQNTHPASRPETSGRYAYLMRLHDGGAIFLADEPHEPELATAPGDAYDEASPELLEALVTGVPFIEGPLADRYGTWVSAFAPIRDPRANFALLGIDFDAANGAASRRVPPRQHPQLDTRRHHRPFGLHLVGIA